MMMPMQQHEDRQTTVERIIAEALATGHVLGRNHELTLSPDSPEIRVRDLRTAQLVAYSSTRADFDQSLEEFTFDYFV